MYSIYFTEKSRKFLKKLPKKEVQTIVKKVYSIKHNPFPYVNKLQGKKLWRLRITDYRAVLDIAVTEKKIIVLRIGHRKNVYD